MLARRQIEMAVKTVLASNPDSWESVILSRMRPKRQIWPYVMVYSESGNDTPVSVNDPCSYENQFDLVIVAAAKLPSNGDMELIESDLDVMESEIKTKLTQSSLRQTLPQVQSISYIDFNKTIVEEDFDEGIDHGETMIRWRISYSTLEGSPEVLI